MDIDYLGSILKRVLEGPDLSIEFDTEQDKVDFILDTCNAFKKELKKDIE